jgi:hypothetical protein
MSGVVAAIGSCCLAICVGIVAFTPPASGWESSLYNAFPISVWALLSLALICGIMVLIREALTSQQSRWWIAGLLLVISVNSIFLSLPVFRGYATYGRADTLTHIGWIEDILNTGHAADSDFYPVTHILGASLAQVTDLSTGAVVTVLSVLFSCLYVSGMYLLGRAITRSPRGGLLLAALASPFLFSLYHVHPHPTILSLFVLPVAFYLYHMASTQKTHRWRYVLLLVLVLVIIALFHPVTAAFTVLAFLVFALSPFLFRLLRLETETSSAARWSSVGASIALIGVLVTAVSFGSWYYAAGTIEKQVEKVSSSISNEFGGGAADAVLDGAEEPDESTVVPKSAIVQTRLDQLSLADLTIPELLQIGVSRYGTLLLYLAAALLAGAFLVYRAVRRGRPPDIVAVAYGIQFLLLLTISAVALFTYAPDGNEIRMMKMPLFFGTVFLGLVIWDQAVGRGSVVGQSRCRGILSRRGVKMLPMLLAVGIAAAWIMSLNSVYGEHRNASYNMQVAHAETAAVEWLGAPTAEKSRAAGRRPSQIRQLVQAVYGVEACSQGYRRSHCVELPTHFGYEEFDTVAEALDSSRRAHYLVLLPPDLIVPLERRTPGLPLWTAEDIAKLDSDKTANRVYTNGDVQIWKVPIY